MPSSLTGRHLAILAVTAAAAAAACSDASLAPTPTSTLEGRSAAGADTGGQSTPTPQPSRPDSARPDSAGTPTPTPSRPDSARGDTVRAGAAVVLGLALENFVFQYRDAAGVAHDSVGARGVGGVSITISATTRPDSTNPIPAPERQVATATSDAKGLFRTGTLPDGWYAVRATHTADGKTRTASGTALLVNGYQSPALVYLNLR